MYLSLYQLWTSCKLCVNPSDIYCLLSPVGQSSHWNLFSPCLIVFLWQTHCMTNYLKISIRLGQSLNRYCPWYIPVKLIKFSPKQLPWKLLLSEAVVYYQYLQSVCRGRGSGEQSSSKWCWREKVRKHKTLNKKCCDDLSFSILYIEYRFL